MSEQIIAPPPGELGLIIHQDPRSLANYPLEPWLRTMMQRRGIGELREAPSATYHKIARDLSQGSTPQCVGYANRHNLEATPVPVPFNVGPDATTVYNEAQRRDGFPLPHAGTTLVAAGDYLKQAGMYKEYRWCRNIKEVALYVLLFGPIIVGSVWLSGMDAYDSRFVIKATGTARGGHAWLVCGWDQPSGYALVQNSWGSGWGNSSRVWIWYRDLEEVVFNRAGEAMAATEPL